VFVGAVVVGAAHNQPAAAPPTKAAPSPAPQRRPIVVASPQPTPQKVIPERSLAGTVREVQADAVIVDGVGGHTWRVSPAPGALIRLNGKPAHIDGLQVGDNVLILGQAQPGPGSPFLAHAITARRR
jgi:hypothetical protein